MMGQFIEGFDSLVVPNYLESDCLVDTVVGLGVFFRVNHYSLCLSHHSHTVRFCVGSGVKHNGSFK